jgi:hypothetical protein
MKISTLLYYVDHGQLGLPCFARDQVWRPDQVRNLFDSLYRGYPVGSLILWTPADAAPTQQAELPKPLPVELLVDGQQRVTSIYNVARARLPHFSKDKKRALTPLRFHVENEVFSFCRPDMKDDPLWIDLTDFFSRGQDGLGAILDGLYQTPTGPARIGEYAQKLHQLHSILDRNLHVEYLPCDISLEEAAEIYLVANGGGHSK